MAEIATASSYRPFLNRSWWIWSSEGTHAVPEPGEASPSHYQVRQFRRAWTLNTVEPGPVRVHVSADSRYILFCNGHRVGRGPAKGDIHHHFYDTYDLSPWLQVGRNVLAALVWDMSRVAHRPTDLGAPCAVMTYAGGFLLEGDVRSAGCEEMLDTGTPGWRVAVDRAHRWQNDHTRFEGYHGYFEHRVDEPDLKDWLRPDYDDTAWGEPKMLFRAERREDRRDPTSPYGLVPRMIPQLEEGAAVPFTDGFEPGGAAPTADWIGLISTGVGAVVVPPHTVVEVVLDSGVITSGYPTIGIVNGRGTKVRFTYAEALRLPWETPGAKLLGKQQSLANLASHFADEGTGWTFDRRGLITGWSDRWEPAGGESDFEPLHWRAFRYVGLRIETGEAPMTIVSLGFRFTAYPYDVKAKFECADPRLEKIWAAGVRTMRLCSHETFEDCPHYEQMQYAGDTMITSHIGMLTTGDARLSRQALYQFDWSRGPEGLTQSRYPSRLLQVIPSWSLHWITTVRDFGLCGGDLQTVRDLLPGMRGVLDWFRRHKDGTGLPARLPYWNITDWCPWWPRGVVPGAAEGPTCIISAQWIQGLVELAEMCVWLGLTADAEQLSAEADEARTTLHALFWSEEEGLYFDRPGGPEVSEYGNGWAVRCGAGDAHSLRRLLARFPRDEKLAPGSFFAWHTGWAAMDRMGIYDQMPEFLGPWHESIALGLDTFVEENSYWRSLCHAWSAHPVLEFHTMILGIKATAPGFTAVRVKPRLCGLAWARGSVCTPRGLIEVSWRQDEGGFALRVQGPEDTRIEIVLPDGTIHHSTGGVWQIGELSS
jgi:alpha-L-rhamnosidase